MQRGRRVPQLSSNSQYTSLYVCRCMRHGRSVAVAGAVVAGVGINVSCADCCSGTVAPVILVLVCAVVVNSSVAVF